MGMKEPDERRVECVRFVTIGVMWYAHISGGSLR